MHDATEAYLGDVIKPLKVILGISYAELEEKFSDTISIKFKLNCEKMKEVKPYDALIAVMNTIGGVPGFMRPFVMVGIRHTKRGN